jgi:hypothetical protein
MDREYDNKPPDWGYRTPHGAVINLYRGMVECWLEGNNGEIWRKSYSIVT